MKPFALTLMFTLALAGVCAGQDIPGRLFVGFNAGGVATANDHERWGASGQGYAYFGETGYEATTWLVAPVLGWGYTYASGDAPPWEAGGYAVPPTSIRSETSDFLMAAKIRASLWRMKLRPYAGGGAVWTEYHRRVMDNSYALYDYGARGAGYALLGGLEFFPDPASGFSAALEYRYAATRAEWRYVPSGAKETEFNPNFDLRTQLFTLGVKLYFL